MQVATILRIENTGDDPVHTGQIVMRDTSNIADLYLERYQKTYAANGAAWDGDPVWEGDLEYCTSVSQAVRLRQNPP